VWADRRALRQINPKLQRAKVFVSFFKKESAVFPQENA
jgi:hypothetical protein